MLGSRQMLFGCVYTVPSRYIDYDTNNHNIWIHVGATILPYHKYHKYRYVLIAVGPVLFSLFRN